jgi:lipid A 3-O-deacylase
MRANMWAVAAVALMVPVLAAAQPAAHPAAPAADPAPLARGYQTRALAGGWGHSWLHGWPGYGKAISDIQFVAFYPQIGWFATNRFELYGEGTAHVYYRPRPAVLVGAMGIGGRYHLFTDRAWTPYVTLAGGLGYTNLDVPEVDQIANFQVVWGAGLRQVTRRGPGLLLEFRNHHISNAGARGDNLGVNAAMVVAGVHWVLR